MTPLMQQYHAIKEKYQDSLVLFQVGDFYELFYDDARAVSAYLGIVLTKRGVSDGEPIPLCGVPCHTFDHYLIRLVQGGFRVVLCEQRGEVIPGKLVERVVTQVFTPGIVTDAKLLDPKSSTVLAICTTLRQSTALLFVELIAGTMQATVISSQEKHHCAAELDRYAPKEVVVAAHDKDLDYLSQYVVTRWKLYPFDTAFDVWLRAYSSQEVYAVIKQSGALLQAFGMLYGYLLHHAADSVERLRQITLYKPTQFLVLDGVTQRTLELVRSAYDGSNKGTLHEVIDHAVTGMGSRIIKQWLLRPLRERATIEQRLDYVTACYELTATRELLMRVLQTVGDIERVIGRLSMQRGTIADYRAITQGLAQLDLIEGVVLKTPLESAVRQIMHYRRERNHLLALLQRALTDDPSAASPIQKGYHEELDRLRILLATSEQTLVAIELREQQATGIATLKLRFTDLYGYAFELPKQHKDQLPERFQHIQSLAQRDRFTTAEIRSLESEITYAQKHVQQLERELLTQIGKHIYEQSYWLRALADELMALDGYIGLASAALQQRYVRPQITNERELAIEQGRHPVVEVAVRARSTSSTFITNELHLTDSDRMWVITGPNMGGKSTFLRQTALIVLLAHVGSFVPAHAARIPLCDRIFTRVGASDHVAGGKSTFLVEMEEIALICREATSQSLVIVDEIGRGTSTYDGMAIAQGVMEYLAEETQSFTLFATHYHELAAGASSESGITVHHAASRQTKEGVILLHVIRPGPAEGSFGIAVARTAQLPATVIIRAEQLMNQMQQREQQAVYTTQGMEFQPVRRCDDRMHEQALHVCQKLQAIDSDQITPRQALDLIVHLKESTC